MGRMYDENGTYPAGDIWDIRRTSSQSKSKDDVIDVENSL